MSPSRISSRIRRIKPSPSSAAADRFAELRREGRDIVNLAIGEPDFDTPAHIRQAGCAAIERGETRYTPVAGTFALREAIAAKLERENGLRYGPREIIVTCGAKHALFNALSVTVEAGHEVIVPAPFWVSYPDMVLACDGTPVVVACREEDDFRLTPEALEAAITPATRWLVFNSPTNPTGTTYTEAQLRALADVLLRYPQVMVLTDDIYEHIRFDDARPRHLLAIEPALRERTLVVNGVSKTYAMTGWRIGYAAGPSDIIAALDMLQSQSTSGVSSVSQAAAVVALNAEPAFLPEWVATYRLRRDTAVRMLNAIPGIRARAPGGAFYLYPHCGGLIGKCTPAGKVLETDNDVVIHLLEAGGVMVLAGTAYGVSPHFRMSTATSAQQIEEGCRRIAAAVAQLS
ncbi:aspartate aminotransferase [Variovorax sp. WS11]|uniref:aspartate transaminase n=1 Tax=Variovorax sp. WS11 TaxID=1105204 RepID=UPI000D0D0583|nr:aspartate transaminase [Variovorax sp. WS11]NDZ15739.1 aspartate transaminase [Variovorax sp. WS11]PSL82896.1 aspartate aminotransferase [Variovorax sp. WS11]